MWVVLVVGSGVLVWPRCGLDGGQATDGFHPLLRAVSVRVRLLCGGCEECLGATLVPDGSCALGERCASARPSE
jgi:hypothetical protein